MNTNNTVRDLCKPKVGELDWFAICTKPHQEKQAESNIRQLEIECFLPLIKERKVIRCVPKTVIEPLFPGYIFARFDPSVSHRAVRYAKGVRNIVQFGASPAVVDDHLVESIRQRLVDGCFAFQADSHRVGQIVRIGRGPLEGVRAIFERELSGPQRVVLLMHTIAYQARLVIPSDMVCNQ